MQSECVHELETSREHSSKRVYRSLKEPCELSSKQACVCRYKRPLIGTISWNQICQEVSNSFWSARSQKRSRGSCPGTSSWRGQKCCSSARETSKAAIAKTRGTGNWEVSPLHRDELNRFLASFAVHSNGVSHRIAMHFAEGEHNPKTTASKRAVRMLFLF